MPRSTVGSTTRADPLAALMRRWERAAGSAHRALQGRSGDWQAVTFRDDPNPARVLYVTGYGDTEADAIHNLLARLDP